MILGEDRVHHFMLLNATAGRLFSDTHTLAATEQIEYIDEIGKSTRTPIYPAMPRTPPLIACLACGRNEVDGVTMKLWRRKDVDDIYVHAKCPCGADEKVRVSANMPSAPFLQGDMEDVVCVCGDTFARVTMRVVQHTLRDGTIMLLDRCVNCGQKPLCKANRDGVHSVLYDSEHHPDVPESIVTGMCACEQLVYLCEETEHWEPLTWPKIARAWRYVEAHGDSKIHTLENETGWTT